MIEGAMDTGVVKRGERDTFVASGTWRAGRHGERDTLTWRAGHIHGERDTFIHGERDTLASGTHLTGWNA